MFSKILNAASFVNGELIASTNSLSLLYPLYCSIDYHIDKRKNKWINSVKDFKKVTKVSDSLLNKISPYFKFPDWISNSKPKKNYLKKGFKEKTFRQKVDLNITTQEQLEKVNGIGKVNSKNIIDYRNKLGGFSDDIQIYQLYGLDYQVINKVLNEFTVKTPKEIVKMNFNSISASDIAAAAAVL